MKPIKLFIFLFLVCAQTSLAQQIPSGTRQEFVRGLNTDMTRPEKSLHILVRSPDSNLHFLVSPEIALHLITG